MEMPNSLTAYAIKVSLVGIEPEIWRRLVVPSRITLPKLHLALQTSLGWHNAHLHQFVVGEQRYGTPDPDFEDETIDERRKALRQFLREPSDRLLYEYDFGDGWEHLIVLEDRVEVHPSEPLPVCIGGERACPPEDVGGVGGYVDLIQALRDPRDRRQQELLNWIGGYFDPEQFDVHATNVRLGRVFPRGV